MVPDLYERMFVPDYISPAEVDAINDGEVFFPATEEDFSQMLAEFEAEEAEMERQGVFRQDLKT